jgi:hypothetical protein
MEIQAVFPKVDLRGMGGKEKEILKLFPNLKRENHSLYDFVDSSGMGSIPY